RGSAGYLLVVDATRPSTLDTAIRLHATAQSVIGRVPVMLAVNKSDLEATWDLDQNIVDQLGCVVVRTSAKTGTHVEATCLVLARAMIEGCHERLGAEYVDERARHRRIRAPRRRIVCGGLARADLVPMAGWRRHVSVPRPHPRRGARLLELRRAEAARVGPLLRGR